MNQPSPASERDARDVALTAEREETKYLVSAERLATLSRAVAAELEPHRFTGEAANRLPGAHHFVTTLYFDTPSRAYYRAARSNLQSNLKIRAKEYYDLHPSLAELATDAAQIVRYQPWLWFELKRREGLVTSKRRFRFPKTAAATLFDPSCQPSGLPTGDAERADAEALIAHVRAEPERVLPAALVNYRRLSYQNHDATLRVTLDLELAFFAVPEDLWTRPRPLVRSELGAPVGSEPRAVVEIKRRSAVPGWLERALAESGSSPSGFSKFVAASEALRGG